MVSPEIVKNIRTLKESVKGMSYEQAYHVMHRAVEMALAAMEQDIFDSQEKK